MSRHFWRTRVREPRTGLTLVELLITIVIAGIAFAAIVPVFVQALTTSSQEKVRLAALNVAQDKIERIRQLDYDEITQDNFDLDTSDTTTWKYAPDFRHTWKSDSGREYDVSYWVDDSTNTKQVKQVYVTVDWTAPPRRVPNTFVHSPEYDEDPPVKPGYGITLSTIIYKQYGGAQVIDINTIPDSSSGVVKWPDGTWPAGLPVHMIIQAVLNPMDDNTTSGNSAQFMGYGANDTPELNQKVMQRDPSSSPGRFQVTWSPAVDGSEDGIYRFEVTVYSSGGLPGNGYAEEFRLESGPPLPAESPTVVAGNGTAVLSWQKSPTADAETYQVWRLDVTTPGPSGTFTMIKEGLGSLGYIDDPVTNGDHYQYYVIAVDGFRKPSDPSSTIDAYPLTPADMTAPPSPVVTNDPKAGTAYLTWPDVADAVVFGDPTSGIDHYVVTRNDGITYIVASPKVRDQTVVYSQTISTDHSYTVVALDAAGNQSVPTAPVMVTYVPPPNWTLTVSANRNDVTFIARLGDATGPVVRSTTSSTPVTWTMPEGRYSVSATRNNATRGPVPVNLMANETHDFVF